MSVAGSLLGNGSSAPATAASRRSTRGWFRTSRARSRYVATSSAKMDGSQPVGAAAGRFFFFWNPKNDEVGDDSSARRSCGIVSVCR